LRGGEGGDAERRRGVPTPERGNERSFVGSVEQATAL